MVAKVRHALLVLFFSMILGLAHPAFAAEASRIELTDGEVYENVSFTVDRRNQLVTIRIGDSRLIVGFAHIIRIHDQDGEDVTIYHLGEFHAPYQREQEIERPVGRETVPRHYGKRPFNMEFRAGINYSYPLGKYYHGIKYGIGFGADIIIPITRDTAIRGTISKSGMREDLESLFPGTRVIEDDMSFSTWRYMLSAQYHWPKRRTKDKVLLYINAGLGMITSKSSGSAVLQDRRTGYTEVVFADNQSENHFAFTYGCGMINMITKTIGIEIGATFDIVFVGGASSIYDPKGQRASIFDLKAGLVYLF